MKSMKIFNFLLKKKNSSTNINGVEIKRSTGRLRTVSLKIKNGKAVLFCPSFVDDNYLRDIILKKKKWIKDKLKQKINIIQFSEIKSFQSWVKNTKLVFLSQIKMKLELLVI